MTDPQRVMAAPPDDGAHEGAYTTPESQMVNAPDDTRAQETVGTEPFKARRPNTGYLTFLLVTVTLCALFAVAGLLGFGR